MNIKFVMVTPRFIKSSKTLNFKFKKDLLSTNVDKAMQAIEAFMDEYPPDLWKVIRLDLKAANMVDSTGLNLIIGLIREAKELKKDFRIDITSPSVNRAFEFSKLKDIVEVRYKPKT